MIATLPAVQSGASHVFRFVTRRAEGHAKDKRLANRRHRRHLNAVTRRMQRDPEHFDLAERAKQVVVISEVSLQIFIADAYGRVRTSTRPSLRKTVIPSPGT